jgi:predicted transposase/invertase (TIGR01784 family)
VAEEVGMQKGREEGREEGMDISAAITKLLKNGIPINEIAEQYNISTNKIEQLRSVLTA